VHGEKIAAFQKLWLAFIGLPCITYANLAGTHNIAVLVAFGWCFDQCFPLLMLIFIGLPVRKIPFDNKPK